VNELYAISMVRIARMQTRDQGSSCMKVLENMATNWTYLDSESAILCGKDLVSRRISERRIV
jgi:hypothetical protein